MGFDLLVHGLVALASSMAGFFACSWKAKRAARARRRMPKHWPLDARRIVNSQEHRVWLWLRQAFEGHHVMIKMPVTRFTLPRGGENSAYLYQLLGGVYCTFTISRDDGRIVGCVDVPGLQGISRTNRQIKLALLSQSGIAYRVLKAGDLPPAAEIRIDFLGDEAFAHMQKKRERAAILQAQQKLRDAVERRRHGPGRRLAGDHGDVGAESDFSVSVLDSQVGAYAWEQANSFIAPLDSRPAGLH
ncbi:MAG: hypothetical protein ACO1OY_08945 [Ramlibacter sp.]